MIHSRPFQPNTSPGFNHRQLVQHHHQQPQHQQQQQQSTAPNADVDSQSSVVTDASRLRPSRLTRRSAFVDANVGVVDGVVAEAAQEEFSDQDQVVGEAFRIEAGQGSHRLSPGAGQVC